MDLLNVYYNNMTTTFLRELFGGKFELYVIDTTGFYR
jgi:hypothetical protein